LVEKPWLSDRRLRRLWVSFPLFGGFAVETSSPFPASMLVSCAVQGGVWCSCVGGFVGVLFGGGLVVTFMSVEFFFFFFIVSGSFSINICPTCSCRWLYGKNVKINVTFLFTQFFFTP